MKIATSLVEKSYFYGLSALVNSMVKFGTYFDKIVVGYRGKLPAWLPALSPSKNGCSFKTSKGFEVEFVEIDGGYNMVHEKPNWLNHLVNDLEPGAEEYCFFDSDLIILNRMSFFGEWIKKGVALCEDINGDMADNHPIRLEWKRLATAQGLEIRNTTSRYYNSGFIGWRNGDSEFVREWLKCFNILKEIAGNLKAARPQDRTFTVLTANQDSLNVTYMITNCSLSTIGKDAMGFDYGMKLMAHPIGKRKPWRRKYIREFLAGYPPEAVDLHYWKAAISADLKPYSRFHVQYKITICKALKALSRFYARQKGLS